MFTIQLCVCYTTQVQLGVKRDNYHKCIKNWYGSVLTWNCGGWLHTQNEFAQSRHWKFSYSSILSHIDSLVHHKDWWWAIQLTGSNISVSGPFNPVADPIDGVVHDVSEEELLFIPFSNQEDTGWEECESSWVRKLSSRQRPCGPSPVS